MKTHSIWKYPFEVTDSFTLRMPKNARVLSVQMQGTTPCLWAIVDTQATLEPRKFRLFGTGHPVDDPDLDFIGTFQMHDGALVFHLFYDVWR